MHLFIIKEPSLPKLKSNHVVACCYELAIFLFQSYEFYGIRSLIFAYVYRCLEEGAEDFLLKPVKLADVKRLRDSLMKAEERVFKNIMHKRELEANDIYSQLKRAKI